MTDAVYRVAEVARELKVEVKTVLRLLRARAIKGVKVGSQWRVSARELGLIVARGVRYPERGARKGKGQKRSGKGH